MKLRNTKRLKHLAEECLITDSNYYKFLHVEAGDIRKVSKYLQSLNKSGCSYYSVENDVGNPIGYFMLHKNGVDHTLIDFFLSSHLRTKEGKENFWELVESKLNNHYFCHIPSKNAVGIKFLESRGLKMIDKQSIGNQMIYKFQKQ